MSDLIQETERLYGVYSLEIEKHKAAYEKEKAKLLEKEKKVRETDFLKEYVDTYQTSLAYLEDIFADWDSLQRRTKGISFRVGEYIKKLSPRPVANGQLFSYVDRLVAEGREAIEAVDKSKSIEDDVAPQKKFCQCLVDLRYVVSRSRPLLKDTGIEEKARGEALAAILREKGANEESYREKTKLKNLRCYQDLLSLDKRIHEESEKAQSMLIGSPLSEEETDFRFLLGFKKTNIPPKVLSFATKTFGVSERAFSLVPVYFEPKDRSGVILIRADKDDYFEGEGGDSYGLIRKIYFSLLSSLGPKNLRLAGVETAFESVVGAISDRVKAKLGENCIFGKGVVSKLFDVGSFNESLLSLLYERSTIYNGNDYRDIYEYNENTPEAKHEFILAVYNYAPDCFADCFNSEQRKKAFFEILEKGPSKGILSVVRVDKNSDLEFVGKNGKQIPCDVLDVSEDGVLLNGEPISVDITTEGFKINDYLEYLAKQNKSADTLSLKRLLKKSDEAFAFKPIEDASEALRIPLGISAGVRYDYAVKSCSEYVFGLLVGMTGSGKSSFLHTLILSASYFYSPEDLQLYLVDFKSGETSPAFANYRKGSPLYVPHIVYLSLRCREESAMDLLNKIDFMIDERQGAIEKSGTGCSDVASYNRSEAVRSGRLKKFPIAFFVIDEYNNMFSSVKNHQSSKKLEDKLNSILKRGRTAGIEILFCGQDADPLSACGAINQIGSKFSLKVNSPDVFSFFYGMDPFKKNGYFEKLKKKGTALIATGGGQPTLVKIAFAGDTSSQEIKDVAAKIREKYRYCTPSDPVQFEAGNDGLFPISDYRSVSYKEGEFALPIGASSANMIGMTMSFAPDRNATGYCALACNSKLLDLERCLLLSYIDKFEEGEFIYASGPSDGREFLDGFGEERDFVSDFLTLCNDKERLKTAEELNRLSSLLDQRREERSMDSKASFKPIYLIIHNVEWLLDEGSIGGKRAPSPKKESKPIDTSKAEEDLSKAGVGLSGSALAMFSRLRSGGNEQSKEDKSREESKTYYISDLRATVSKLYEKGSAFSIFLILSNETLSELDRVRGDGANARSSERFVYDSYEVLRAIRDNKSIEGAQKDDFCVYDALSSTRTRLFDYSLKNNASWWEKLKRKRKQR